MAPATVNRYLALLRAAFRLALKRRYKHADPMAGVEFVRENNERDRICSPDEFAELIGSAHPELRLVIMIGYWMGMRLGEIAGLRWEQIDLRRGIVRLSRGQTKEGAAKVVPLPDDLIAELKHAPRRLDGRLFSMRADSFSAKFAALVKQLEISDLRLRLEGLATVNGTALAL